MRMNRDEVKGKIDQASGAVKEKTGRAMGDPVLEEKGADQRASGKIEEGFGKARRKVARIHARITDRRRDFLHKLTTRLVRENQTIVIEDLNVSGMLRNGGLARAISDVSWSELASRHATSDRLMPCCSSREDSASSLALISRPRSAGKRRRRNC